MGRPLVWLALLMLEPKVVASQCSDGDLQKIDGSNPEDYCLYRLQQGKSIGVGQPCMAHPEDLTPTQAAFGEVDAACVRTDLEQRASKRDGSLKDYLISHPVPAVLGPSGKLYLTDHHHLNHALLQAFLPYDVPSQHRATYVCPTVDLRNSTSVDNFWQEMQKQELVWLRDEHGAAITPDALPSSVKYLRDDPFRTLAEWSREAHGFVKCGSKSTDKEFPQCSGVVAKPFIEFKWANLYRTKFDSDGLYVESDQAQVGKLWSAFDDVVKFSLDEAHKAIDGWNKLQKTDKVSLDDHGCLADSAAIVV